MKINLLLIVALVTFSISSFGSDLDQFKKLSGIFSKSENVGKPKIDFDTNSFTVVKAVVVENIDYKKLFAFLQTQKEELLKVYKTDNEAYYEDCKTEEEISLETIKNFKQLSALTECNDLQITEKSNRINEKQENVDYLKSALVGDSLKKEVEQLKGPLSSLRIRVLDVGAEEYGNEMTIILSKDTASALIIFAAISYYE